jgi:hypothetical protein
MEKPIKFLCIILDEKLNLFKIEAENLGLDPYKRRKKPFPKIEKKFYLKKIQLENFWESLLDN